VCHLLYVTIFWQNSGSTRSRRSELRTFLLLSHQIINLTMVDSDKKYSASNDSTAAYTSSNTIKTITNLMHQLLPRIPSKREKYILQRGS
jgi:hypothetical protein